MKRYRSIALLMWLTLFGVSAAYAEEGMERQQGQPPKKGMGMDMGQMEGMSEEQKEEQMRAMQEDMLKMHDLMNRILEAKDPNERQRLKDEHLKLMMEKRKAHRQMMHRQMERMKHGESEEKKK